MRVGWLRGVLAMTPVDDVAYGFEVAECVVGDFDLEGLFDFEGDVDLIEGVDVELVEGAVEGDRVGRDAL